MEEHVHFCFKSFDGSCPNAAGVTHAPTISQHAIDRTPYRRGRRRSCEVLSVGSEVVRSERPPPSVTRENAARSNNIRIISDSASDQRGRPGQFSLRTARFAFLKRTRHHR